VRLRGQLRFGLRGAPTRRPRSPAWLSVTGAEPELHATSPVRPLETRPQHLLGADPLASVLRPTLLSPGAT
jgi:hypothetical protein